MEGPDESTELWRHPNVQLLPSFLLWWVTKSRPCFVVCLFFIRKTGKTMQSHNHNNDKNNNNNSRTKKSSSVLNHRGCSICIESMILKNP